MTATPVTATSGTQPYSDMPVIVGPVLTDFGTTLQQAVTASGPSSRSATLSPTTVGSPATSGIGVMNGTLVTGTGRNLLTLGQMVGAGTVTSSASPLGVASITRPSSALSPVSSGQVAMARTSTGASAPAALLQYGNGRIPLELLTPIGIGGHRLYAPAAQGFMAMRAAAAAEGIDIGITDSYRTYEQQVDLAARKGLYKDGGYAAVPGTSKHGWGMAIDIDVDAAGQAWMRANAARFGFVENVPREPWHWEFVGVS